MIHSPSRVSLKQLFVVFIGVLLVVAFMRNQNQNNKTTCVDDDSTERTLHSVATFVDTSRDVSNLTASAKGNLELPWPSTETALKKTCSA